MNKSWMIALAAFFVVTGIFGLKKLNPDDIYTSRNPAQTSDEIACPLPDGESLEKFRDLALQKTLGGNYQAVKSAFQTCFPQGIPKCLEDTEYYNRYKSEGQWVPSTVDVSDEERTLVSEKDLPPEFLATNESGDVVPGYVRIPKNIMELAKDKGWKVVSYKTRSTGGFDSAPNLLLVVVPGKEKDIYLQISPPPDANSIQTNNNPYPNPHTGSLTDGQNTLTVITMDKTKNPPVSQLRLMHKRERQGYLGYQESDIAANSYKWTNRLSHKDCAYCHTVPLRSISPIGYKNVNGSEQKLTLEEEENIRSINNMMVVDRTSWGNYTVAGKKIRLGPPIDSMPWGWSPSDSPTRREEFIKACAGRAQNIFYKGFGPYSFNAQLSSPPQFDYSKISQAMNCYECHNNGIRGTLHDDYSEKEIRFKILVDRTMPVGSDLSMDERLALVQCLKEERESLRSKWATSGDWAKVSFCEDAVSANIQTVIPSSQTNKGVK